MHVMQQDKPTMLVRNPRRATMRFITRFLYWCHWILRQMIVRHLAGAIELCTQCKVYACVLSKMRNSTSSLLLFNLDVCSSDGVRYAEGKAEWFVNELQNERNRRSNIHYWILDLKSRCGSIRVRPKVTGISSTRKKKYNLAKKKLLLFPWLAWRNICEQKIIKNLKQKKMKRSESSQQL